MEVTEAQLDSVIELAKDQGAQEALANEMYSPARERKYRATAEEAEEMLQQLLQQIGSAQ